MQILSITSVMWISCGKRCGEGVERVGRDGMGCDPTLGATPLVPLRYKQERETRQKWNSGNLGNLGFGHFANSGIFGDRVLTRGEECGRVRGKGRVEGE